MPENFPFCSSESAESATRYHGTTLDAVISMIAKGGFIPGQNGHGRRGKYLFGLFCCTSVGEALLRVDPWREQIGKGYQARLGARMDARSKFRMSAPASAGLHSSLAVELRSVGASLNCYGCLLRVRPSLGVPMEQRSRGGTTCRTTRI